MSSFLIIYFCFILPQLAKCNDYNKFDNYTAYEVTAFNSRERAVLYFLYVRSEKIVFVNGITNEAAIPMDVIVDNSYVTYFEDKLRDNDIEYFKVNKKILARRIQDLHVKVHLNPYSQLPNISTEFHTWEMLMLWVDLKLKKFPALKKIRITWTAEKREIFVLKISTGKRDTAVFLMGGEDGRDWLSPAILLNFVNHILEQKLNVDLLTRHYDFYVLPVFNPDGYQYSTTKKWYWSRNRKTYFPKKVCPKNASAIGINIDRNWFFSKETVRDEDCVPVYTGSKAVAEEETEGLARFLDSIALQMLAFMNIRGFEQLITIPYAFSNEYCNNYLVLLDILSSVHDRVKEEHGRSFFYGTTAKYFYNFTGNVADWVKKKLNTPIVYTFYMKDAEFIFPSATDIEPLTAQFSTMMKEILLLASSIYSPLFNNQIIHLIEITTILLNIVITLTI